jgi:hypothetical protein
MGKPNLRIARPRSKPRQELAEAIDAHDALVRRLAGIEAAERTARQDYNAASAKADRAPALIEKAKNDMAAHLTDVALGSAGRPPKSMQIARADAQETADIRDAARAARDTLASQREQTANALITAGLRLDRNVDAVIASEAPVEKLVAAHHVVQRAFASSLAILQWMDAKNIIPKEQIWRRDTGPAPDGAEPWQSAARALETDADANLPLPS